MSLKRHIVFALLAVMLTLSSSMQAQQLPLSDQYLVNRFALSPAYAGHTQNFEAFLSMRKNWTGVDGAPVTRLLSLQLPITNRMGLGGYFVSDQVGIFSTLTAQVAYAYHLPLGGTSSLSFGLNVGAMESRINIAGADTETMNDPVAMANANVAGWVLDAGLGISYRFERFHTGIYVPRLIESEISENLLNENTAIYTLSRHYQWHAGYSFIVSRDFRLDPTAIVRTDLNSPVHYEAALLAKYRKLVWAGGSYHKDGGIGIHVGGLPHPNLAINYTYETGSMGPLAGSNGSHEITLGFTVGATDRHALSSIFNVDMNSRKKPYLDWINKY